MENKILVLYLKPIMIEDIGTFSENNIKMLCNSSIKNQNKEIFFLKECFIASFQYEGNNYAFVLTKENNIDEIDGVSWPTLAEILAQRIPGTYDIHFVAQHIKNLGELNLPVDDLEKDRGGIGDEFHNRIKSLWEKFGNDEFGDLIHIMIHEFETKIKGNVTVGESVINAVKPINFAKGDIDENEGSESKKSEHTLDDILKELQQHESIEEIIIVLSSYYGNSIKFPGQDKCFILIEEIIIGDNIQSKNEQNIKKVLAAYSRKHVYMAIHGLSYSLNFARIKHFGEEMNKTLYYCDFHHTPEYNTRIVEPYERIINEEDIEENYEKLKKAIKEEYWLFQMLEAINQVVSIFFPMNIDLRGLEEIQNESKAAYFNDITQTIKKQQKSESDYFIKKLVNLRFFINGDSSKSKIDDIAPDIDLFKEFNLKSFGNTNDKLKTLKELSGLNRDNSPITRFMKLLDQSVSLSNDSLFNSIHEILQHFERQNWTIRENKINNFNDWFLLLATSLTDIKKQIVDKSSKNDSTENS